jgi:hypothetical protein
VARGTAEERELRRRVTEMQRYDFRLRTAFYERDGSMKRAVKRVTGSRGPFYLRMARLNPFSRVAVVKDPVGCLLTHWLTSEFGFQALVLLRHPVAFVASTRRLGWDLGEHLASLFAQRRLVEEWFPNGLAGVAAERLAAHRWDTHAERGALLWAALNSVLLGQAAANRDILLMRHEDLSARPLQEFRRLFEDLSLPWSHRVERRVRRLTGAGNRAEAGEGRVQDFTRDSAALLDLRLGQVEAEEREQIWDIAGEVAAPYYPRASFRLDGPEATP